MTATDTQRGEINRQYKAGEIGWQTYSQQLRALSSQQAQPRSQSPQVPQPVAAVQPPAQLAEPAKVVLAPKRTVADELAQVRANTRAWVRRQNGRSGRRAEEGEPEETEEQAAPSEPTDEEEKEPESDDVKQARASARAYALRRNGRTS